MCDYKDYQPKSTERIRENIEWTRTNSYNATDTVNPRIWLMGDSLSHNYHGKVRDNLKSCANIANWATSKCVTDPDYFRELDFWLDSCPCQMICFNNGVHGLTSKPEAWRNAYERAVAFMRAKLPQVKLSLVLCMPLLPDRKNENILWMNEQIRQIAQQYDLSVLDLYSPMAALDLNEALRDSVHYQAFAVDMQAQIIAQHIREELGLQDGQLRQQGTKLGPSGAVQ